LITINSDRSIKRHTNAEPAAPLLRRIVYARFHAYRRRIGGKRLMRRGRTLYVSDAEVCIFLMSVQAEILRRTFSIVHTTVVIAARRAVPAMAKDKCNMTNEK
jgi:hypothetical protein